MVLDEYLSNPMGKGASMFMITTMKNVLDKQYSELQSKIRMKWYLLKDNNLIAHIKIPSHSLSDMTYDVIFEFDLTSIADGSNSIKHALVNVFSNCPSFAYTFAYVFNEKNLLCHWARNKYDEKVLSQKPQVRNAYELISYERSLYLGARYLLGNGRDNVRISSTLAVKIDGYGVILSGVRSLANIMETYNKEKDKETRRVAIVQQKPKVNTITPSVKKHTKTTLVTPSSMIQSTKTSQTAISTHKTTKSKKI